MSRLSRFRDFLVAVIQRPHGGLEPGGASTGAVLPIGLAAILVLALANAHAGPVEADAKTAAGAQTRPAKDDAAQLEDLLTLLPVRIAGLDFLRLHATRTSSVNLMRGHGYDCFDEAATATLVPCTLDDARRPQSQVVLTFLGERLDKVATPLPRYTGDLRDEFDRRHRDGLLAFPNSWTQRGENVWVSRSLPGDGSLIELRYFVEAKTMELVHFAPILGQGPRDVAKVNK